ncbi:MAG TPA: hypothetical protein VFI06_02705 [Chitinophagaceae bacterium]|nr:hypothetical protein [Chitinophagaceae bacterium]
MKRIFVLGVFLTLLAGAVSAQGPGDHMRRQRIERSFNSGALTRPERTHLQRNEFRLRTEKRRALRDGRIDRFERRKLQKMRRHERRNLYRFRHNGHRRLI